MACQKCSSDGEVTIHFTGLNGLAKPIVWVFSKLAVCLECGSTEFVVPERELRVLLHDTSVVNAVVLTERGTPESRERQRNPISSPRIQYEYHDSDLNSY